MILAHSGIIHALYGGFFGLAGVVGALMPDILGAIGWIRWMGRKRYAVGTWWDFMPEEARTWFWLMHSLPVALSVAIAECLLRSLFGERVPLPVFGFGYLTHVVSDWLTHRHDVGDIVLRSTGKMFGVDWWRSPLWWTEWTGALLVFILLMSTGWENLCCEWIARGILAIIP